MKNSSRRKTIFMILRGGFRGIQRADAPFLRASTFWYSLKTFFFWRTDPNTLLKAPLAPICINRGRGARTEKHFLVKIFHKCLKTPFWTVFFLNSAAAQKFGRNKIFIVIWEISKIQFGRA